MKTKLWREIILILRYRFNLDDDKATELEVKENICKNVEFKGTNLWTLIFAIFIASIGLNVNSTAVIIGAMLVSPLMGPIMGLGLGAATFDFELIKLALKNLLLATVIALLTSFLYFLISPLQMAQSELLARTTPTIWDVLIAFFGGLAGIVASSRRKYNNVIPGVAIATALMPPLCTAGYGLATGQWSYFFGAFYLYLINSIFISIATYLMVRFLKFSAAKHVNEKTAKLVQRWIGYIALLTILPSIYLAYTFVNKEIFRQRAGAFVAEELIQKGVSVIEQKISPEEQTIRVTLFGEYNVDSLQQALAIHQLRYSLEGVRIVLKGNVSEKVMMPDLNQVKEGLINDLFTRQEVLIKEKDQEIAGLKLQLAAENDFQKKKEEALQEFCALYGTPEQLVIEKTLDLNRKETSQEALLVYVQNGKKNAAINRNQLQKWVSTKFGVKAVKVIID